MLKKKEILFIWDGENWNPNGDMLKENAPRCDDRTEIAEVTDVRIKRTIRDELLKSDPDSIFVKEYKIGDAVLDAKSAIRQVVDVNKDKAEIEKEVLSKFIDVRAFGAVIPIAGAKDKKETDEATAKEQSDDGKKKKGSSKAQVSGVNFTGAVQFRMTKSLHQVEVEEIQGTGAFASSYSEKQQKEQATIRTEHILKYALFATYGIIDNYNAEKTGFSEEDEKKILKALWHGTKNLTSRSKIGQTPRFMLMITYKDDTFAGDLNNSVKIVSGKEDRELRSINDLRIDLTHLKNKLARYADNIEKIEYISDYDFESINQSEIDSSWEKLEA